MRHLGTRHTALFVFLYYPQKAHFGFTYIGSEFVGPFYSPASKYYIRFRYTGDPDDAIALRDAFLTEHAYPAYYDSSIIIRPFKVALYFGCGRTG